MGGWTRHPIYFYISETSFSMDAKEIMEIPHQINYQLCLPCISFSVCCEYLLNANGWCKGNEKYFFKKWFHLKIRKVWSVHKAHWFSVASNGLLTNHTLQILTPNDSLSLMEKQFSLTMTFSQFWQFNSKRENYDKINEKTIGLHQSFFSSKKECIRFM